MSSKKSNKKTEAKPMPAVDLKNIVDAGPAGMFVPQAIAEPLQAEGLIEINLGLTNDVGEVACRATEAGIAKVAAPVVLGAAPVGRGRSGSKYPFDALEVGQSFFVPDSAEHPDASKSLASTVSGATQRYSDEHPTATKVVKGKTVAMKVYSRKFALRKVEGGARVWRIACDGLPE